MGPSISATELDALRTWLAAGKDQKRRAIAAGYQGQIHLYESSEHRLAIKEALGFGPLLWVRRWMLRREYAIYRLLDDYAFAPRCFGLLEGRYLLLELVDGEPFRHAEIVDREGYFELMREAISELHRRGIAHGDLKRKENLLVVHGSRPCFLDFGTAVTEPAGFAPLRAWMFRTLVQHDINAWLKLKSNRQIDDLADHERPLYRRSATEKISRFSSRAISASDGEPPGHQPSRGKHRISRDRTIRP